MSKRKRRKKRKSRPVPRSRWRRQQSADLEEHFRQADDLIDQGRAQDAVDLLELLLDSYPRVADVHYYLGYARAKAGDVWGGVAGYERAMQLSHAPGYWLPLASLYLELGLNAHALHAFRQVLRYQPDASLIEDVRNAVASLEQDVTETANHLGLPSSRVEKGLRYLEEGQRALQQERYPACIAANRRAIKLLGAWPPPHNNLSLAYFFDGQPKEAIATARRVLLEHPHNVQALSNAIRFLAWAGRKEEASALWARLRAIEPEKNDERLKVAEAAAVMGDDERVYELLKPLDKVSGVRPDIPGLEHRARFFLAIAEANLGKSTARSRLRALLPSTPWLGNWLRALQEGRPGPGWAEHFPYFLSTDFLPARCVEEFIELVGRGDEMSPRRFEREVTRFTRRFPQIVLMGEKLIWEDMEPDAGIAILATVGTPAAYAALRRFGLSQAGGDDVRMRALSILSEAGEIAPDETLRIWLQGEWRESQMRQYEIADEPRPAYSPQVAHLLNGGLTAIQQGDHEQAERMFQRALEMEPRAKEAYNNLATIFARRGEYERAKEMFRAALDVDPLYVMPRCNLSTFLLDEGDVEGALDVLRPLADVPRFHPQEMAFYSYVQARIFIEQDEFESAKNALEAALEVWPGYEPAENLLGRLNLISLTQKTHDFWWDRQHKRDQAKRARLQAKLTTPAPSLSEVLPLYTKEALTGTGRVVLPRGGWSVLRKAELIERLVEGLTDSDNVERLVADVSDEEREALQQVMANGGHMPWQEFDARYGNDLEESRYWQWHEPETIMGRLRLQGLLVETTVEDELLVAVPLELRPILAEMLG